MRYFSEDTVIELMAQAELNGEDWEERKPIDLNDYPSIEIKKPHGDIKDTKDILDRLAIKPTHDSVSTLLSVLAAVDESPTIIEASKKKKK